jgi:hypothetical protein
MSIVDAEAHKAIWEQIVARRTRNLSLAAVQLAGIIPFDL